MRGEKLGCGTAVPEGQRLHHLTPPAPLPRRLPQPSTTNACAVCSGLGDKAGWQGAMARRDAGDKATPDPSRDVEEQLRDLIAAPSCSSPHRAGADRVRLHTQLQHRPAARPRRPLLLPLWPPRLREYRRWYTRESAMRAALVEVLAHRAECHLVPSSRAHTGGVCRAGGRGATCAVPERRRRTQGASPRASLPHQGARVAGPW